jgi:hypothetical protein
MYESLKKESRNFHLYIFAFDDLSFEILSDLKLDYVTIISLEKFETPELKEVKTSRSVAEYCWTCTPSTISHVLHNYDVPHCTYIDADLYFYSDPSVLIAELQESGKSVLITEHRFSFLPKLYEEKRGGRFCVQFITFIREEKSMQVLEKWRGQCIEWCYSRYEDGKFGDQKYLEVWPLIYSNIHILEHQGGGIAPWNLTQYVFTRDDGSVSGINLKSKFKFTVVFYHFQYVKFMENNLCDIGWYYISSTVKKVFYEPYITKIKETEEKILNLNTGYKPGLTGIKTDSLKNKLKALSKNVFGYNILKIYE